jgi:hypothetical protein
MEMQPFPAIAALLLAVPLAVSAQQTNDPVLVESRRLADELGQRLITALTDAVSASGPVAAIAVCRDLAPEIASDIARRSGAKVGRTSDRLRNPGNVADAWQADVLDEFAAGIEQGRPAAELEHFSRDGGTMRYMRPIVAGGICLTCHGAQIADDVAAALGEHYPHDRATGYAAGDLRGAFVVVWPGTADD